MPTRSTFIAAAVAMLVATAVAIPAAEAKVAKIAVCHLDEYGDYQLINVPAPALAAHLSHGDAVAGDGLDENCEPIPPTGIVVTNGDDSGPGSLRDALTAVLEGETITFDPSLAGDTIALTSGPLVPSISTTIDASAAPGIAVDGGTTDRVLIIDPGLNVIVSHLTITNGAGQPQGGGILNNGELTLDHVTVTGNAEVSAGPASFDFGGGGIYNGNGATLYLFDSTVSDNTALNQPGGGVYGFFNSFIRIERSTISGNLTGDVAGGIRSLGDVEIVNSTLSGNTSTNWHGGGVFHTDGTMTLTNSTVTGNFSPAGTANGLFVATFGAPATLNVINSIVDEAGDGCGVFGGGAAVLNADESNVFSDGSCNHGVSDQAFVSAWLAPLADNGGPTLTHALLAGSPAIDVGNNALCPATDQRGVDRADGVCDVGSYEVEVP